MSKICILMGSDSDLKIMSEAAKVLEDFGVDYEMGIISAHRTPEKMVEFAKNAKANGFDVIIAGAGGAAHVAGVIAGITTLPVIGVPIKSATLSGLDSLYSIVQMPSGIPVATVAINGAKNAGILAVQMLAIGDDALSQKIADYKKSLAEGVYKKDTDLKEMGYEKYIKEFL